MALYHLWRSLVMQIQKDPSGVKVLTPEQEQNMNGFMREATDFTRITDLCPVLPRVRLLAAQRRLADNGGQALEGSFLSEALLVCWF